MLAYISRLQFNTDQSFFLQFFNTTVLIATLTNNATTELVLRIESMHGTMCSICLHEGKEQVCSNFNENCGTVSTLQFQFTDILFQDCFTIGPCLVALSSNGTAHWNIANQAPWESSHCVPTNPAYTNLLLVGKYIKTILYFVYVYSIANIPFHLKFCITVHEHCDRLRECLMCRLQRFPV